MAEVKFSSLAELEEAVRNCRACSLRKYAKQPVPGEGSGENGLMVVGEAPGAKEDEMGRPFVGRAGKVLDMLMEKAGIRREESYITNIVKCRPPGNRDPTEEEKEACSPYLLAQIDLLRPKVVVPLGRHSASFLFHHFRLPWEGISRQRGRPYRVDSLFHHFWLFPTYHPAVALYRPQLLPIMEEDWKAIGELLRKARGEG